MNAFANYILTALFVIVSTLLNGQPKAIFTANKIILQQGDLVYFTDQSISDNDTYLTEWLWEFEGGNPNQFFGQNPPPIVYNNIGSYTVSLSVKNNIDEINTSTKNNLINVYEGSYGNWTSQFGGFTSPFRGISSFSIVDSLIVWAIVNDAHGNSLNIFTKTLNGGELWEQGSINDIDINTKISSISAIDQNKAWISTYNISKQNEFAIYHTNNGGELWVKQNTVAFDDTSSFLNFVHFFNHNEGICVGDPVNNSFEIYYTTNGGLIWEKVNNIPVSLNNEKAYVNVYCVHDDIIWFSTSKGRIFKSINKGFNWQVISTDTELGITNISFNDNDNGLIVYKEYDDETLMNIIAKITTDGGNNWIAITNTTNMYITDIKAVPYSPGYYFSVGNSFNGLLKGSSYTNNHGQSWINIDYDTQYTTVAFLNINVGWAGGYNTFFDENGIYKWKSNYNNSIINNGGTFNVNIYPNPFNGCINILISDDVANEKNIVNVYSVSGHLVFTTYSNDTYINLDLSFLENGVYIISINNSFYNILNKIIKAE